MQRFSQRESVLLGYSPRKTPGGNSDTDFDDVFGGPPTRSSIQETRHSFVDDPNSSAPFGRSDETAGASRNPWSGLSEKPVFGEEGLSSRRRNSRNDFFDDIFRGNIESLSSSPRKYEMRDPFAPAGSQLLSPSRPLPHKAEPFASSFPAQFSLPAKLNKGIELPTFGSPPGSTRQSKDGSNYYANSPLSRFSVQANQDKEEVRNDFQSSRRFSALSQELCTGSEESTNLSNYDETETKGNSKEDFNSSETSKNGSHFHFSIYKWADKGGVPLAIPIRGRSDRVKEKDQLQRCSSANGWIACENVAKEPKAQLHDRMSRDAKSFRVEHKKIENGSLIDSINGDGEQSRINKEEIPMSESKIISSLKSTDENVPGDTVLHSSGGEEKTHHSLPKIDLYDKREKEVSAVGRATQKPQSKPLNLLFDDKDGYEQGNNEVTRNAGTTEISGKSAKKLSEFLDDKNFKKQYVNKRAAFKNVEDSEASVKRSPRNSWDNGKTRVKGKVKEFVKIFNQDASLKPRTDTVSESHSSRRKERDIVKPEKNESSSNMTEKGEKTHMTNMQKKKSSPDILVSSPLYNGASEKNINSSVNDIVSGGSKTIVEDPAESFEDNFLIEDLTPEEKILPQFGMDPEETQVIDAKIRQWSNGKQGNIRSLLSTLQYVLWPDSGWKPVPLVDIIEGHAVKRSYQKALLYLHPDKLQQKGAASDQKYIAEKVFDILQDAWTHFSSLGSV